MFGLLINPRPHQDESLLGYLQRLAKANGLPRKELLTAFARADETDVADWLQMMEGPLSWPAVSAEFRDPRPKGVKLWTTHHARYCPICLRIPRSSGHPFHEHLTTDSTLIRPPI
ncbi:TniQ family protein, partial [Pseudomonas alloputida]|uniref:TniQ family protein n=1 Tax=Pseudomonas alloputida TaxID=1940621 RepID=UPI001E2BEE9B